jgi:hypothetical protein
MAKNKYNIKIDDVELTFHYISQFLYDNKKWKDEKNHLKAIKLYKKLRLEELFNLTKKDNEDNKSTFINSLLTWCKQFIKTKQWKQLRHKIKQAKNNHIDSEQEIAPTLSPKALKLLQNIARQENKSISELIISVLEHKIEHPINPTDNNSEKKFAAITNDKLIKEKIKAYKIIKKDNQSVIELWHYAGGQCQALSQTTHQRCKRITPELSIRQQFIGNIVYEFAVCHTHNKDKSHLDQSYLKLTPID